VTFAACARPIYNRRLKSGGWTVAALVFFGRSARRKVRSPQGSAPA